MAQPVNPSALLGTDTPTPRSGFGAGSRGFVSTCVLGPQGYRGVWIERQRGNMDRTVFAFTTCQPAKDDGEGNTTTSGGAEIEGRILHEVKNSYDLGGQLAHCGSRIYSTEDICKTRGPDSLCVLRDHRNGCARQPTGTAVHSMITAFRSQTVAVILMNYRKPHLLRCLRYARVRSSFIRDDIRIRFRSNCLTR